MNYYIFVFIISMLGIMYVAYNFHTVLNMEEGTAKMVEVAAAIREGANAFLYREYRVLIIAVTIISILIGIFLQGSSMVAYIIGVFVSALAGFVGMKSSTYANVRTANKARKTKDISKSAKVALRGGAVMGKSVAAFSHMGYIFVAGFFGEQLLNTHIIRNWCGLEFEPFSYTIFCFSFGCSTVAIFNRVGGGIFTKAADMGADLVGKTEENIPEDDPCNPGVIADNVGDNVGDTAGLGSDLLESYVGAFVSAISMAIFLYIRYNAKGLEFSQSMFEKLRVYPLIFCTIGLLSCIIGLICFFLKKNGNDARKELNIATWLSAGLTAILNFVATSIIFRGESCGDLPFKLGIYSPYVAALIGIVSGILIGAISEYYTSYDYKPTKGIAKTTKEGAALTVLEGLVVGMESIIPCSVVLGISIFLANSVSGMFGISMAAVGMLSFVAITVSIDTFGPICDNAGGIAEMCNLSEDVRNTVTDPLDSVGNTTAAIGKGFAIGAATYTTISLMNTYMCAFMPIDFEISLNALNPMITAGMIIGMAVPFYFSSILGRSVRVTAGKMVLEVRRQFREIPGLREGTAKPKYKKCVEIATDGALEEMKLPAFIAIAFPVIGGFVMGPEFVGGFLFLSTITSIGLAIFFGNSGGAWDNAKKLIESYGKKGTDEHIAAVTGDTLGDPLKDTIGPSLDILIKIMCTVALITVPIFSKYNLISFIGSLLK